MRYWFHPLRKESWKIDKRLSKPMLGLKDKYRKTMRDEMKLDDRVVFYLASGISRIVGIYSVASEYFYDETKIWGDEIYPHRLKLKPVIVAQERDQEVDIREIINNLSFIRDKNNWGMSLRPSLREIQREDFELIKSTLQRKQLIKVGEAEYKKALSEEEYKDEIKALQELESTRLHDRIGEMLYLIGLRMDYDAVVGHRVIEGYELDVAWLKRKNPHIAIEIQTGGNPRDTIDRLRKAKEFNFRKLIIVSEKRWEKELTKLLRYDSLRHWIDVWSIGSVYEMYQSGKRFFELYETLEESRYKEFEKVEFI